MELTEITPELTRSHWMPDRSEPILDQTIGDALREAAGRWRDRTALIDGVAGADRRRWSFEDLLSDSERVARALLARFSPGEHVALWAANCPEWVLIEFGAALAGITLVTVNPAYQAAELAHVLRHSRACGIIVQPDYRGRDLPEIVDGIRPELPDLRAAISLADWEAFLAQAAGTALPPVSPGDRAQIQYTSGTTGFPKGAQLAHRGLANNGRLYARAIGAGPGDVWINPMPMFHTAGCGLATLGALQTGGTQVLPPAFDPAAMLDLFAEERGTIMLSVPTMLIRILEQQAAAPRDVSSWRLVTVGGAPVPPELLRRAAAELGIATAIGFGQTEASPYITHTRPDDPHPDWMSTVGRPLPQVEVKIVDPQTGETVPLDTVGEICTRSPCVMTGYFDNPAGTAEAIDAEGWLHTGDLATMDRYGYCRIQGRLKDLIIRGGENIYPREVEDILFTHPGIAQVAVVGLPHPDWGEVVAAFVQARPGHALDEAGLEEFCRRHLASFKVPRLWRFVDQFPQTASGKIQKFALRDRFLAGA